MRCIANTTNEPKEHVEIKITEEMVKDGVAELCGYDSRFESMEEAVTRIFTAMAARANSSLRGHP